MSLFKDKTEFEEIYGTFMKEVLTHPIIGPKLSRSNLVVAFEYTDPDVKITVNFKEKDPTNEKMAGTCLFGDSGAVPDVVFKQSADFSNRFWQGKENVIAAIAKRQVAAKGSITKALALIPVIRPSFRIYPQVLKNLGKQHLIVS